MSAAIENLVEQFESRKQMGVPATVNRDPKSRTSGGDQLYIQAFDNQRLQIGPHGYQG